MKKGISKIARLSCVGAAMILALNAALFSQGVDAKSTSVSLSDSATNYLYVRWEFALAKDLLDQALEIDSKNASALADLAWWHVLYDRYPTAEQLMQRAVAADPDNPLWKAWLGWIYLWHGSLDQAELWADRSIEADPEFAEGLHVKSKTLVARREYVAAISFHQKAASLDPQWEYALAHTLALAGRVAEAEEKLKSLADDQWNTFGRAKIYLALGRQSKALEWMQKAHDRRHPYFPWCGKDSDFRELRQLPSFQTFLVKLGLP